LTTDALADFLAGVFLGVSALGVAFLAEALADFLSVLVGVAAFLTLALCFPSLGAGVSPFFVFLEALALTPAAFSGLDEAGLFFPTCFSGASALVLSAFAFFFSRAAAALISFLA